MKSHMKERVLKAAHLIIHEDITIREIADKVNASKSTVYVDLISRLPRIDAKLAESVREILEQHAEEKYLRGGQATKEKWMTC